MQRVLKSRHERSEKSRRESVYSVIQCKSFGFLVDEWRKLIKQAILALSFICKDTVTVKRIDFVNEHGTFSDSY